MSILSNNKNSNHAVSVKQRFSMNPEPTKTGQKINQLKKHKSWSSLRNKRFS